MLPAYFMPECPDCSNYEDREVVYLGYLNSTFGHVLMDTPQWSWFLDSDFAKTHTNLKFVYTSDSNLADKKWARDLFRLFGLMIEDCEWLKTTTIIKKVWIPDAAKKRIREGLDEVFAFDALYKEPFKRIISKIPKEYGHDKIYFSRTNYANHKEVGEWRIEQAFKNAGYEIVYPEKKTIIEQLILLRNCTHFAATEGSVSHLSVFCRPEAEVAILTKTDIVNAYQMLSNEISGSSVLYINAHHTHISFAQHPMMGPFYLYVTPAIKKYLKQRALVKPYWLNPDYWWYVFHNTSSFLDKYFLNRKIVHKLCKL